MKYDCSGEGDSAVAPEMAVVLECSVRTKHPLFAFVTGTARGWTLRVAPNAFVVVPVQIEDYCGAYNGWNEPKCGQPMFTKMPLKDRAAARRAFIDWAQRAFDKKWQLRSVEAEPPPNSISPPD
jgi:hypothetical protein